MTWVYVRAFPAAIHTLSAITVLFGLNIAEYVRLELTRIVLKNVDWSLLDLNTQLGRCSLMYTTTVKQRPPLHRRRPSLISTDAGRAHARHRFITG